MELNKTQTQTNDNFFEPAELNNLLPMKRLNQSEESYRDPPPTFPDNDPLKPRSLPPAPQKKGTKRQRP